MDKLSSGLILLTYKGKVLLMHKQSSVIDKEARPWSFIGGIKEKSESFEKTLTRRVQKEMGIKVENIEFVSELCYHAKLTDDNVNCIKRSENQLLDFFTLKEVKKLFLSKDTERFILNHGSLVNPIVSLTNQ
ncbi:MAG TPA: NUDIX domain-containing protein [Candidatus Sulfotelmatobacter sp.]|nr:NUDIX domain-containing protein [Candidatus Sulfotelmatobacter sp.]